MVHIYVMGASGSGTTSLGGALAVRLDIAHLDTDDFFWLPTDPPFTTPRDAGERIRLLLEETRRPGGWVLSGSALKWGTPLELLYDLIVFLRIEPELRMARIRAREVARYGNRIGPGGDMEVKCGQFLEWAASYDTAGPERRSLAAHEQWLETQTAPVLRLDSSLGIDELAAAVLLHPAIAAGAVRRRRWVELKHVAQKCAAVFPGKARSAFAATTCVKTMG